MTAAEAKLPVMRTTDRITITRTLRVNFPSTPDAGRVRVPVDPWAARACAMLCALRTPTDSFHTDDTNRRVRVEYYPNIFEATSNMLADTLGIFSAASSSVFISFC